MKALLFAYDGTGLGHLMRLIKIGIGLSEHMTVMVVSGHTAMPKIMPKQLKYYQLPNFYEIRNRLSYTNTQATIYRMKILDNVFREFSPDVFLTDYLPLGKRCELFHIITKERPLKYFVLRSEIGGEVFEHRDVFSTRNSYFLSKYYKRIFIASDPIITPAKRFDWLSNDIKNMLMYTGLVVEKISRTDVYMTRKSYLPNESCKWIVCSAGGGKCGEQFICSCVDYAQRHMIPNCYFDIVSGYYGINIDKFNIKNNPQIRLHQGINGLNRLNASADVVFCCGGYNTLLEAMQGKEKTVCGYSVMNKVEEDEQYMNICNFKKYYDIHELQELDDIGKINLLSSSIRRTDRILDFDGIYKITNQILKDLEYHS